MAGTVDPQMAAVIALHQSLTRRDFTAAQLMLARPALRLGLARLIRGANQDPTRLCDDEDWAARRAAAEQAAALHRLARLDAEARLERERDLRRLIGLFAAAAADEFGLPEQICDRCHEGVTTDDCPHCGAQRSRRYTIPRPSGVSARVNGL